MGIVNKGALVLLFALMSVPLLQTQTICADEAGDFGIEVKRIIIDLAQQRLYALDGNGYIVLSYPVSSGKSGFATPTGHFRIYNKSLSAYSQKYDATMTNWMAFTPNGGYGMHGLLGSSYYRRLGSPASHGCVRLTREGARELFGYVKVGTPVDIVRVPDLNLPRLELTPGLQSMDRQLISETLESLFGDHTL